MSILFENGGASLSFSLSLQVLSLERVEILQRVLPLETEVKAFKEYQRNQKPVEVLSDEDKFIMNVSANGLHTHTYTYTRTGCS